MTPIEPQYRQLGLSDYLAILNRRKWIIIQSTVQDREVVGQPELSVLRLDGCHASLSVIDRLRSAIPRPSVRRGCEFPGACRG